MRLVIQRVKKAKVAIDESEIASIGEGLLILVGISKETDPEKIPVLAKKSVDLRIFEDERGKFQFSALDKKKEILVVSQFTLCASFKKGRRPDFSPASESGRANELYQAYCTELEKSGLSIQRGVFAANMQVELINDGPVTLVLDQHDL